MDSTTMEIAHSVREAINSRPDLVIDACAIIDLDGRTLLDLRIPTTGENFQITITAGTTPWDTDAPADQVAVDGG